MTSRKMHCAYVYAYMSCEDMWNVSLSCLSLENNDMRKETYKMEHLHIKILMKKR